MALRKKIEAWLALPTYLRDWQEAVLLYSFCKNQRSGLLLSITKGQSLTNEKILEYEFERQLDLLPTASVEVEAIAPSQSAQIVVEAPSVELPFAMRQVYQEISDLKAKRQHYHGLLSVFETEAERYEAAQEVLSCTQLLDELWDKVYNWKTARIVPKTRQIEDSEKRMKRIGNLRSYISKYRKWIVAATDETQKRIYSEKLAGFISELNSLQ